jgi:hypothetical protein
MRIIKATENASGNLTDAQVKFMRELNTSPTFNRKEKPWTLVKIPKSTTRNVAWHIRVGEENFQALQMYSHGEYVKIYRADLKGKSLGYSALVKEYSSYVDLETAVDRFYEEYAKTQSNEKTTSI